MAGAVLGNLDGVLNDFSRGSRFGMFWETVVISGFGIRSSCRVASARLRLPQFFFRGRRSIMETSTKKWLKPR